jgi:hypothetical protein
VRLQLTLDRDDYPRYEAVLSNAGGEVILRAAALHARSHPGGPVVVWHLPARLVQPGDYIVDLAGQPPSGPSVPVNSYSFRILRK